MAMTVELVKVIVLGSLLVLTFVCGMLPVLLLHLISRARYNDEGEDSDRGTTRSRAPHDRHSRSRLASYKKYISFLSCFAAGVFLATCFLDLLPSVRHNLIRVLFSLEIYTGFPVAEFVMAIGLFLILIVEQVVLTVRENHPPSYSGTGSSDEIRQPLLSHSGPANRSRDEMTESYHSDHSLGGISDQPADRVRGLTEDRQGESHVQGSLYTEEETSGLMSEENRLMNRQHSLHSSTEQALQTHSPLRAILLVCALSLHSIFEGLTIGLLTKLANVLGIFAALAVHKSILSFSLGMNLIQSRISLKSIIKSIILFSIASPVGIAIGIAITDLWDSVSSGLVHGLLQGIASGTFLYIIFFEILPKEFNCEADRLLKVLCLIVGYATVTGILFLSDDIKHPFCVINQHEET